MNQLETNAETIKHIRRVQHLLSSVAAKLVERALAHDESKLREPEASVFSEYTAKLKGLTYGSEEYKVCLAGMKPALDHHYAHNSHHPEHWPGGIKDMSLLDLIEMLVDWKAASERHADGDIERSITINKQRFGYGDEVESIFRRTTLELYQAYRQSWHCFGCGAGGMQGNFCEQCGAGKDDYGVKEKPENTVNPYQSPAEVNEPASDGLGLSLVDVVLLTAMLALFAGGLGALMAGVTTTLAEAFRDYFAIRPIEALRGTRPLAECLAWAVWTGLIAAGILCWLDRRRA